MHYEKFISSEDIFKGVILNVKRDTVELENGARATREVVRHNGAVCIAPLTDKGELVFVRQYRYVLGRELLELPAGKLDSKSEDRFECAVRELKEETGYSADKITFMGNYVSAPGFTDELLSLYLAEDLHEGETSPDEDEFLDVVFIPLERAVDMVMKGELDDGKTQTLVLKIAKLKGIL